jgi:hypothetical protein
VNFTSTYKVRKMAKAYNPNALENISDKIKAKVKAAGNSKYKAVTKTVTFTIKVK